MCRSNRKPIDTRALRHALGHFPTGVAVVTTAPEGCAPAGMTINSFHSISLEPALVGWCIARQAGSYRTFQRCGQFTFSFLDENQRYVADRFARPGVDRFAGLDSSGPAGPVIPGACAWLRCRLYRQVALGDHLLIVGKVSAFGTSPGHPLVFAGGKYGSVQRPVERELPHPAALLAAGKADFTTINRTSAGGGL
ncbi:flavin reductase family protein [Parahaliea maris]|uniref:Flavin reductase family protein n=1 Tax=Parahaliea maris TaxID=2716870 RepID=A0A5C9A8G4_9GAMM|nr:flavin reductase family protein [Parahaliea maris]TXS95970.1 flavin reductase family protein [Parahaliea maris]